MKAHIRQFRLLLIAVTLACCSDSDFDTTNFKDNSSIKSQNGTWKVISFEDYTNETVETQNQENSWGHDIVISFNDAPDPNTFGGRVTTNSVTGEFEYLNDREIKLLRYGTTFVGQPSWGDKFGQAVSGESVTYKIDSATSEFIMTIKQRVLP